MPYLIENSNEPNPRIHALHFGSNRIGRESDNNIVISDNKSLSRHHAEIQVTNGGAILTDLDSLNHTFINEQQSQQGRLKDGDQIRFGRLICQFVQTLPGSLSQLPGDSAQNWSIIRRLSPENKRLDLLSLLQTKNSEAQKTIPWGK